MLQAAADPRLAELAERLTAYEQATDPVTLLRTQMEHVSLPDLIEDARAQLVALKARKARLAADLLRRIRLWPDLARHLDLVRSLPGAGPIALSLAARRCDPGFRTFADRLAAAGKQPRKILVAVMRKLIEAANLVIKRDQPWQAMPTDMVAPHRFATGRRPHSPNLRALAEISSSSRSAIS